MSTAKKIKVDRTEQIQLFDIYPIATELIPQELLNGSTKNEPNEDLQSDNVEAEQTVDPRNSLNDLTGKEWLPETKSFFFQKGLGSKHPHAQIERLHPAPYSFQDIGRLILFFTKKGDKVLDPFGGVGSTAKACALNGRICTSIELSPEWHELSIKRLETEVSQSSSSEHIFINADCIPTLKTFADNSFDFMVTSPPYWAILNKKADHKVKKGRVEQNLATNYSTNDKDLGNIEKYEDFLETLVHDVFQECGRVLKEKRYMCIIVSDFRNKSEFISFHSDLIQRLSHIEIGNGCELTLQGVKVLAQNHKSLLPYGYPFAYVENIHHQYILIFRKIKKKGVVKWDASESCL
jgi:DNA modification methylase